MNCVVVFFCFLFLSDENTTKREKQDMFYIHVFAQWQHHQPKNNLRKKQKNKKTKMSYSVKK
jgi:hypothetical protein